MLGAPLPNAAQAWVPREKMTGYLLDFTNRIAMEKNRPQQFTEMGYHTGNLEVLERDLIYIAQSYPVVTVRPTEYGTNYGVDGTILSPNGQTRNILTAWTIPHGDTRPRFTSAYPHRIE